MSSAQGPTSSKGAHYDLIKIIVKGLLAETYGAKYPEVMFFGATVCIFFVILLVMGYIMSKLSGALTSYE